MIIGIAGRIGAGKTTIAKYLQGNYGFTIYSFGDPLKKVAAELFMVPLEVFYDSEMKESVNSFWGITYREMLQVLGTECVRGHFGFDFWVKRMKETFRRNGVLVWGANVVIDDVRFFEEMTMIAQLGGHVIRVIRPDNPFEVDQSHKSEQFDSTKCVATIDNNLGIMELQLQVRNIREYLMWV